MNKLLPLAASGIASSFLFFSATALAEPNSISTDLADKSPFSSAFQQKGNSFNPQVSVILDGQFSNYESDPEDYELPGFTLGGEAGLSPEGFGIGHTEFVASANIDRLFYGQMTLAIADHEGETETELEEAFFDTIGLGGGVTVRGGRFLSAVGYLNQQHAHSWDFADAPLIYRGLWGKNYIDDGLRVSWVAPTDMFLELGAEALSGGRFPAGGERSDDSGAQVLFINTGGDIGVSHSWQAGISYFTADVSGRTGGGHSHHGEEEEEHGETPSFTGDSSVTGAYLIYKWAPDGNVKKGLFKLQGEFFSREEDGQVTLVGSDPLEESSYDGTHEGFYIQASYRFAPQWQAAVRYDALESEHSGADADVLEEAGLDNEGVDPERVSLALDWLPSEFSRIRLQYSNDESTGQSDAQWFLQYTMSLGAHGAHTY